MTGQTASRRVERTVDGVRALEGGGFMVRRPFPTASLSMVDPFLLLDEMGPSDYGPGEAVGAPEHPHRGFETVTYMLEGEFEHRDSAGHEGWIGPGDVQWMTAGRGVVHSELPAARVREEGGRVHGLQLWVNLPRAEKLIAPRYQDLRAADIPVVEREGVRATVIAGAAFGVSGPAQTHVPIVYVRVQIAPRASVDVALPGGTNAFVYVLAGSGATGPELDTPLVEGRSAIYARRGAGRVSLRAGDTGLDAVVLAGQPLDEPVARYGPFVMNTKQEILDAFADYEAGRLA